MLTHTKFLELLTLRWDHGSVPIVAKELLAAAAVVPKDSYDIPEIGRVLEVIVSLNDPRTRVILREVATHLQVTAADDATTA